MFLHTIPYLCKSMHSATTQNVLGEAVDLHPEYITGEQVYTPKRVVS